MASREDKDSQKANQGGRKPKWGQDVDISKEHETEGGGGTLLEK